MSQVGHDALVAQISSPDRNGCSQLLHAGYPYPPVTGTGAEDADGTRKFDLGEPRVRPIQRRTRLEFCDEIGLLHRKEVSFRKIILRRVEGDLLFRVNHESDR